MAKWEYEVVKAQNRSHLADQLKTAAQEDWEPILYQFATAPTEMHYVIMRRSPAPQ